MAVATLLVTGVALTIWPGDGSRRAAREEPSTTTTTASTHARRTKTTAASSTTVPTPSTTTAPTESEPQWFCADHGAPSPHYVGTRAPTDHVCTDSELAADPPRGRRRARR